MKVACSALLIAVLMAASSTAAAELQEQDFGRIVWTGGGTIHVQGKRGRHVLVPVGVCDWCKSGTPITVTFRGLGKATLRPDGNTIRGNPVDALVLSHGPDPG